MYAIRILILATVFITVAYCLIVYVGLSERGAGVSALAAAGATYKLLDLFGIDSQEASVSIRPSTYPAGRSTVRIGVPESMNPPANAKNPTEE